MPESLRGIGRARDAAPDMWLPGEAPVPAAAAVTAPAPDVPRTAIRRRSLVLGVVLFLGIVAGSVAVSVATSVPAPVTTSGPTTSRTVGGSPWRVGMPDTTDSYTRSRDQAAAVAAVDQLRAAGVVDPVGAAYVSDLDPRNTVLIYGAAGTAFGHDLDDEIAAALDALRRQDLVLSTPVGLTLPAVGGKGTCVSGAGGGFHTTACVFVTHGAFLVFRFGGPGTAAPEDAAAQVPLLAFDIIKPA